MGATVAAACRGDSVWAGVGRSNATRARADAAGLVDVGSVEALADRADMVVSVCPPEIAEDTADLVARLGFNGLYVDANAVSPATALRMAERFDHFVDGGIIGPPANTAGTTRLYLSGAEADRVADRFAGSVLDARILEGGPGAASAVKMAYAAWTKGTAALLLAVRALAEHEGVGRILVEEWALSQPDLAERSELTAAGVAPKAWRWVAEMDEIASTFEAAGLPRGFHDAAARIFEALAGGKGLDDVTLDDVMADLLENRSPAGPERQS